MDHAHHYFYSGIHFQKIKVVMRRIAFFDFDGTITTHDSLLEFIRYHAGTTRFYFGFIIHTPWLIAYKLRLISNQRAKEMILQFFFSKMPVDDFEKKCGEFAQNILPSFVRKKALQEINLLKQKGVEIVVVSASPENWVGKWCQAAGIRCIATRLESKDGKLSGRIAGINCHGNEKKARIRQAYDLKEFNEILCYGDTNGDKPLLSLATIAFYKPFR